MKKKLLSFTVLLFTFVSLLASPVDVNTAMDLGQKFVKANFEKNSNSDLDLSYTVMSDAGDPCIYVFNEKNYQLFYHYGELIGFTGSSVSIKRDGCIFVYDEKDRCLYYRNV